MKKKTIFGAFGNKASAKRTAKRVGGYIKNIVVRGKRRFAVLKNKKG